MKYMDNNIGNPISLELATEISELINRRNQLSSMVNPSVIMNGKYFYIVSGNKVIAAVGIKKVNWYQLDLFHLVVHEDFENKGFAKKLLNNALLYGKESGLLIAQCTVRYDNIPSLGLFNKMGFDGAWSVTNPKTNNMIQVLQIPLNSFES